MFPFRMTIEKARRHFEAKDDCTIDADEQGRITYLSYDDHPLTAKDYQALALFVDLQTLSMWECEIDERIWKALANFGQLNDLSIPYAKFSGASCRGLLACPKLTKLDFHGNPIDDLALPWIAKLQHLVDLNLVGTRITGPGLAALTSLTKLRKLSLVNTLTDDEGLESLAALTSLQELELEGTAITNQGVANLSQLKNLNLLSLHNGMLDESALVHLESLQKLESLYFCYPVTELGLKSLRKLKSLQHLYISDEATESRDFLRKKLPDVGVY